MTSLVIAPAPPPVTGQSSYYPYLKDLLQTRATFIPLYTRSPGDRFGYLRKTLSALSAFRKILSHGRASSTLVVLDSGFGLWINAFLIAVLRLKGSRLLLSHHTFLYINTPSISMRLIQKLCGPASYNLFLCSCMADHFQRIYRSHLGSIVINNSARVSSEGLEFAAHRLELGFQVGYISNVTFEKGIKEFIDSIKLANAGGAEILGLIAGPANGEVRSYLERETAASSGRLKWLGPVYGSDKAHFFNNVHVILFPTKYEREAQPNVLLESLQSGIPCITTDRGCISEDLENSASVVTDARDDFVSKAAEELLKYKQLYDNREWRDIEQKAKRRFSELLDQAIAAEQRVLELMIE